MGNDNGDKFMIYDLVNFEQHWTSEDWLSQTKIAEKIVVADCGLSLSE